MDKTVYTRPFLADCVLAVRANWVDAGCPVERATQDGWVDTGRVVGDFCHDPSRALGAEVDALLGASGEPSTVTVHCYAEHTARGGCICHDPEAAGDDAFLWGEGSPEELADRAREELEACTPRTAANDFRARCAMAVLAD